MAVTLNKANLVLKDANGNIGKIEQLSDRDLAKIRTAVSDVALVVNQSNHTPIKATANNLGVVKPDNNTIKIDSNGVLTATAKMPGVATTTNVGVVKPDGTTITVDGNGTLTCGVKTIVPVTGKIEWFAFNTPPDGYLVCNGANVSRTTYADLFAVIGTTFGSGDGSTTFTLPNLIDRFVQGSRTVGNYIGAGLPNVWGTGAFFAMRDANEHYYTEAIYWAIAEGSLPAPSQGDRGVELVTLYINAARSNSIYGSSNTVQPPALTLLPCIKY